MNLEEYNIYDEEYISCISELLENSSVQSMRKYIQHGSTTTFNRYSTSYGCPVMVA